MFNHRVIFLSIMSALFVPLFSMQYNLERIVQAAKTGDLATIQALDPQGTNPVITTGQYCDCTPVHIATAKGHLDIVAYYVKKLESQGKDVNPPIMTGPRVGWTPLYIAASNGRLALVDYYVKKLENQGKDINPVRITGKYSGCTPLHIAAYKDRLQIVDYYVKKLERQGKEINPRILTGPRLGLTPLHIATQNGCQAIVDYYVKKLERQGKDINPALTANMYMGWRPLHIAAQNGWQAIVDYYVKKLESQGKDINPALTTGLDLGLTPLCIAALHGKLSVVDCYVKKFESQGKDINPALTAGKEVGWTPMHMAANRGHLAIVNYYVKKLESQGKEINPAIPGGWTPLHSAALNGCLDIVKTLIYHGALITAKDPAGHTAEDVAQYFPHEQAIAHYLHTTAPLTQQLLEACSRANRLMVVLAQIYKKPSQMPQDEMRSDGKECETTYQNQAQQTFQQIKQLIAQGAEVNIQGKKGYSPLHYLIGYYNPESPTPFDDEVRTLIDSGLFNLDAAADNGDTALSLAAQCGNSRMFKYLLKKGANPTNGINPFSEALQHNQPHILKYLLMGPVKQLV